MDTGYIDFARLRPGYILARPYFEIWDSLSTRIATPKTNYTHFSILGSDTDGNWFTIEQAKITAISPIEVYRGHEARCYSVRDGDADRAFSMALDLVANEVPYEMLGGWAYVLRSLPAMLRYWATHGFGAIPWDVYPNVDKKDRLNCLTLLRLCYPGIVPEYAAVSPAALEEMYRRGRLVLEQEGIVGP